MLPPSLVAVGLVLRVALGVSVLAGPVALGRAAALLAGPPRAVDVVLAGLDLVGLAAVVRAVQAARDEALLVPELPGRAGEAAVAAEAAPSTMTRVASIHTGITAAEVAFTQFFVRLIDEQADLVEIM